MSRKLITILFILFTIYCKGYQNNFEKYDKYIWNAMLSYKKGDFNNSLFFFQTAFKVIPNENSTDYFYAASAALNLKKDSIAEELIINSIINTNASKDYFKSFSEFNEFRKNKIFMRIEKKYDSLKKLFLSKSNNRFLNNEINKLITSDQKVRKTRDKVKMRYIDSININKLINITKKYGWQEKGWIILWHHRGSYDKNNYIWKYFKPYINQQISEGRIRKGFWAFFEEEKLISKEKKQLYGLYLGQFDTFPIKNIENIDERRKKIGEPPLWYLNEVYGIELPKDYKIVGPKIIPLD